MKTRHRTALAALTTTIALIAASLVSSGAALGSAAPKIQLVFWHHTYPPAETFIRTEIAAYEKLHPNVAIKLVTYPSGTYDAKVAAAFAEGNPPDIINMLDYAFPEFLPALSALPPKAFGVNTVGQVRSLYVPGALDGLMAGGRIYGVPEELDTMELFLNAQLFRRAGLNAHNPAIWPKTWSQLFALAKRLTKKSANGRITQIGFNWVWGLDPFWYAQQYWPVLVQYGCHVVAPNGKKATVNSPQCVAAFTHVWESLINDGIGGPAVQSANEVNALQDFSVGRQAMAVAGPWAPSLFDATVRKHYVVAPFPQLNPHTPHTMLYSYALTVSKHSAHPFQAWQFINFLTRHVNGYIASAGYIDGRKGWQATPAGRSLPGAKVWLSGYEHGSYVWRSAHFYQEATIIKHAIENFGSGSMTVRQALNKAAANIDHLIRNGA